jgi:hypothetical protein
LRENKIAIFVKFDWPFPSIHSSFLLSLFSLSCTFLQFFFILSSVQQFNIQETFHRLFCLLSIPILVEVFQNQREILFSFSVQGYSTWFNSTNGYLLIFKFCQTVYSSFPSIFSMNKWLKYVCERISIFLWVEFFSGNWKKTIVANIHSRITVCFMSWI